MDGLTELWHIGREKTTLSMIMTWPADDDRLKDSGRDISITGCLFCTFFLWPGGLTVSSWAPAAYRADGLLPRGLSQVHWMMVVNGHKTITSVLISGETINYNLFRWISIRRSRGDMPIVVVRKIKTLGPDLQIILFLFRIRLQLQIQMEWPMCNVVDLQDSRW